MISRYAACNAEPTSKRVIAIRRNRFVFSLRRVLFLSLHDNFAKQLCVEKKRAMSISGNVVADIWRAAWNLLVSNELFASPEHFRAAAFPDLQTSRIPELRGRVACRRVCVFRVTRTQSRLPRRLVSLVKVRPTLTRFFSDREADPRNFPYASACGFAG